MAQASSAQREPSMEEILASIRRIIEDGDGERKRETDTAPGAIAPAANDVVESSKGIEAFRAEFQGSADETAGARATRLPDDAEETAPGAEAAQQGTDDASGPDATAPTFLEETPLSRSGTPELPGEEVEFPADAFDDLDTVAEAIAPTEPEAESIGTTEESRPPLTSMQTGRQVAAAFGELSEAFAASRRRSFDDMAEQMLRPMLQDWLDNNLPHLVERLVREEIERIARG